MRERNLSGGKGNVQEWNVTEDSNENSLEAETKVTETVDHALLSEGEVSSLADHQISPLDANNRDEVTGLSHLESFSGVANGVVRDDRVSVEPRGITLRIPSALGVSIRSSERLVTNSGGISLLTVFSIRVVKSDINSGVDILIPTE